MNENPRSKQQDEETARALQLIAGFLQGALTYEEHKELDRWVEASDDHMLLFEQLTDNKDLPKTLTLWETIVSSLSLDHALLENLLFKGREN